MNKREVVIVSAVRTAIGEYGGSLKDIAPTDLAGLVIREAVQRAEIDSEDVGHCIIGSVTHSDRKDMYMSRSAALKGGLSVTTPAVTVNRLCGSGLQSIISAAQLILLGDCDIAVAGGVESMSRVPYWVPKARFGIRMGDTNMVDPMVGALTCPVNDTHMGITAENVAEKWNISREEQDALALESHKRAEHAINDKRFVEQILPVELKNRKGVTVFEQDEHVRFGSTAEQFSKLLPAFKKDGSVTVGNSSGINDAAAAIVMMDKSVADAKGLKPMAKLVNYSFAGVEPKHMGIGPVPAIKTLLEKANLSVDDIDVWEINEAFASQALAVVKDLKIDPAKVNPNGSGISLGHPIGATGSVITVKALYELKRTSGKYAVVSMCIGGGQGIASLFECM
ncbi:acetyl-CoA C-acyltransferase [Psychromonas sp. MB-3u-54]|uniref:acetyl-CoA C-acyltransferase family protein n=1 Tax=Psychromonas sp. MB-3u-54 TaxID=2058319 RepID=UPI000C33B3BA|nr:acetyl-CoA C-acyltransferase family protein [Psychromonas sp. MB-3u-54]PKH01939.1 acetyl-CoA C-acyltransferase [Psychromonas sp. MB-3u-54]